MLCYSQGPKKKCLFFSLSLRRFMPHHRSLRFEAIYLFTKISKPINTKKRSISLENVNTWRGKTLRLRQFVMINLTFAVSNVFSLDKTAKACRRKSMKWIVEISTDVQTYILCVYQQKVICFSLLSRMLVRFCVLSQRHFCATSLVRSLFFFWPNSSKQNFCSLRVHRFLRRLQKAWPLQKIFETSFFLRHHRKPRWQGRSRQNVFRFQLSPFTICEIFVEK